MTSPARRTSAALDGATLAQAFAGGAAALEQQADAINAINVFPVPDGDTGTNMWSTAKAAAGAARAAASQTPAAVLRAAADAALMAAKGNSGVILSQILERVSGDAAGLGLRCGRARRRARART